MNYMALRNRRKICLIILLIIIRICNSVLARSGKRINPLFSFNRLAFIFLPPQVRLKFRQTTSCCSPPLARKKRDAAKKSRLKMNKKIHYSLAMLINLGIYGAAMPALAADIATPADGKQAQSVPS